MLILVDGALCLVDWCVCSVVMCSDRGVRHMGFVCVVFFFFQAEDGIRDLVRSRGLGDVYKRQVLDWLHLVIRWAHVVFGIAWIGASFYFIFLENSLNLSLIHI